MKFHRHLILSIWVVVSLGYTTTVVAQDNNNSCEEVCNAKVAEQLKESSAELQAVRDQLLSTVERAAAEAAHVANAKIDSQTTELEQLQGQLESTRKQVQTYQDSLAENVALHEKTMAALNKKLQTAEAEISEYTTSRIVINVDLLKEDIQGLKEYFKDGFQTSVQSIQDGFQKMVQYSQDGFQKMVHYSQDLFQKMVQKMGIAKKEEL